MKKNHEIIFYNKSKISLKNGDTFQILDEQQKQEEYQKIEKEVAKKDKIRRICTKTIFWILFVVAIVYTILKRNQPDFWFFLLLIVFVASWTILYFVFGLIFYPNIQIDWHFKDIKSPIENKCVTYYSSHYRVYMQKYEKFLGNVDFTYTPNASKKRRKMIGFAMVNPKRKGFIFNGKVHSNVPYFAFYLKNGKKFCFFPGFVLYLAGKHTKVISYQDFRVEQDNNIEITYSYISVKIYCKDECLESFYISNNFNMNFFNFKF